MQFARKLLIAGYRYPTIMIPPTSYTTTQVAYTSGATWTKYDVPADGWYKIEVQAGGGGKGSDGPSASGGGKATKLIYLYQGMTCVLWSGDGPPSKGYPGACGYPGTPTTEFGGRGDVGSSGECGGSGGGPAVQGVAGNTNHFTGGSGGGSGFLAGFTDKTMPDQSVTLGSMTLDINRNFQVGSVVTYTCIPTYVMCGGGGGSANDNGSHRASGGGGGAFGSGGSTFEPAGHGQSGPAGSWGKGENGVRYGGGTRGAWAIVDFSTNTFTWGLGGGTTSGTGYCRLSLVIPS